jgi:ribose transport system substrate-binding protein
LPAAFIVSFRGARKEEKLARVLALLGAVLLLATACGGSTGSTSNSGSTSSADCLKQLPEEASASPDRKGTQASVDTSRFKKSGPWRIGISTGYMNNSWVVFELAYVKYGLSQNSNFAKNPVIVDAGGDANKQISDIQDLITAHVDGIIFWPIDQKAILPVLQKAVAAGIPTVNASAGFTDDPGVTSNAIIDQYDLGRQVGVHLVEALKGHGKILEMLGIAAENQTDTTDLALRDIAKVCSGVQILDTEHGEYNRAKSQTIGQNWTVRFPQADGVFCTAGQMAIGVAQAYLQAGQLNKIVFSPGDQYNGWLKFQVAHPTVNHGAVTEPNKVGYFAVQIMADILTGKSVTKGTIVPIQYIPPSDIQKTADTARPDDWWASDLPTQFLPTGA